MTNKMPPGWYYADGDPPGTQRYWDGTVWQGAPQMTAQAPPNAGYVVTPRPVYAEPTQAPIAIVMSILGWITCCGVTCPIGWWMANTELKGIQAGLRDPSNEGTAKAAQIIGIVGTVIVALVLFALFIPIIFAAVASVSA